jgi:hypothetical protein
MSLISLNVRNRGQAENVMPATSFSQFGPRADKAIVIEKPNLAMDQRGTTCRRCVFGHRMVCFGMRFVGRPNLM